MWQGQFGKNYLDRNPQTGAEQDALCKKTYGVTFSRMIESLGLPRDISILEVGCGAGNNLELFRDLGYKDIRGMDVNPEVWPILQRKGFTFWGFDITYGTIFTDNRFDLVFTAGVLIHLRAYRKAMKGMSRICNGYIMGLEYYAPKRERIDYPVYCVRDNWSQKWIDMGFDLVSLRLCHYQADKGKPNPRVDEFYLMRKTAANFLPSREAE